jgi:hypothetical protein
MLRLRLDARQAQRRLHRLRRLRHHERVQLSGFSNHYYKGRHERPFFICIN